MGNICYWTKCIVERDTDKFLGTAVSVLGSPEEDLRLAEEHSSTQKLFCMPSNCTAGPVKNISHKKPCLWNVELI